MKEGGRSKSIRDTLDEIMGSQETGISETDMPEFVDYLLNKSRERQHYQEVCNKYYTRFARYGTAGEKSAKEAFELLVRTELTNGNIPLVEEAEAFKRSRTN